jgi:hypothetical protein
MPKFPRFTSGTFGRLDFATMNDLFDRVEQLESSLTRQRGAMPQRQSEVVLCYVLSVSSVSASCMKATWTAAVPNTTVPCDTNTTAYPSRSSTGPGGSSDYPLYGKNLAVGQSYLAHSVYLDDGSLIYRAIEGGVGGANVIAGKVTGSVTGGIPGRWIYTMEKVVLSPQGDFVSASPSFVFSARNGAEMVADSPIPGPFGVGAIVPTSVGTMQRQAIRDGVVAMCLEASPGQFMFSMPNAYRVVC